MVIIKKLKKKLDPNIHHSAPNCTIKKNYRGSMPSNPPNKARRDTAASGIYISPQYYPSP